LKQSPPRLPPQNIGKESLSHRFIALPRSGSDGPNAQLINNDGSGRLRAHLIFQSPLMMSSHTGATFVLNPRRSSSRRLRGASVVENVDACALVQPSRSPFPPRVAYFPARLVIREPSSFRAGLSAFCGQRFTNRRQRGPEALSSSTTGASFKFSRAITKEPALIVIWIFCSGSLACRRGAWVCGRTSQLPAVLLRERFDLVGWVGVVQKVWSTVIRVQ
jgi:hypothetical protein